MSYVFFAPDQVSTERKLDKAETAYKLALFYFEYRLNCTLWSFPGKFPLTSEQYPEQRVVECLYRACNSCLFLYGDLLDTLIEKVRLSPSKLFASVWQIWSELMSEDVTWGKIVVLFTFTGCLVVQCAESQDTCLILKLTEWVGCFFQEENLNAWIFSEGGGWLNGFIPYAKVRR